MKKVNKHIEIVSSTIPGLSSMSLKSRSAIKTELDKHYTNVGITIVNNILDLNNLVASTPDLVFLGMKFIPANPLLGFLDSNKIWLSEFLANNGIACTGSSSLAHRIDFNKPIAKRQVIDEGLATSPYLVVTTSHSLEISEIILQYPLFVKPTDRGGGAGIDADSIVHTYSQLQSKIQSITDNLGSDSLVEQYLPGREFSVAIMKNDTTKGYYIMPIELIAPLDIQGVRLLSAEVKSADAEQAIEIVDIAIKESVSNLAISVFHVLGARDYGRIDIRLDNNGTPQFLEANLIPSLIEGYGSFPKACIINDNIGYKDMLLHIVRLGLKRSIAISNAPITLHSIFDLNPIEV